jgi:hypothetical protein
MRARLPAAPLWVLWLSCSFPAFSQEPPPTTTPESPATPEATPPPDTPAPLTPEEEAAIAAALASDAPATTTTPALPDLSQVNVGAMVPGGKALALDLAFIFDGSGAWFSDAPLQTGEHDPDRTGFKLQELEMTVGASVDPFLRFDGNVAFKSDEVEVEEAYVTTTALPFSLQLRAGEFLTHFGRLNEQHPHAWSFVDQPLVLGKLFGGDNNRGLGGELSWLTPLPWFANVIVSVQEAAGECCARSYAPVGVLQLRSPLDLVGTVVVEQFFPVGDDLSILLGLNGQAGPGGDVDGFIDDGARAELAGADLLLKWAPPDATSRWSLSWQSEGYLRARHDRVRRDDVAGADDDDLVTAVDGGGYSQLVWRVDPQWETGGRVDVVSGLDDDPLDPDWTALRTRYALQGTYYPSHFSRLRLEASADVPGWRDQPIFAVMLQLEVVVGAHGAHAY